MQLCKTSHPVHSLHPEQRRWYASGTKWFSSETRLCNREIVPPERHRERERKSDEKRKKRKKNLIKFGKFNLIQATFDTIGFNCLMELNRNAHHNYWLSVNSIGLCMHIYVSSVDGPLLQLIMIINKKLSMIKLFICELWNHNLWLNHSITSCRCASEPCIHTSTYT